MASRSVSPLNVELDDRVVAHLDELGVPRTRTAIFRHFDDDFCDEEDCAKCLSRLVAAKRLLRETRARDDGGTENVFLVPGASRMRKIAAAAQSVVPASIKEEDVPVKKKNLDKFELLVAHLEKVRAWLPPKAIAQELKESPLGTSERLRTLAGQNKIQAHGNRRGLRYAALGVDKALLTADIPAPPKPEKVKPEAKKEAPPKKDRKKTPRKLRQVRAGTTSPEFKAPVPVPVPQPDTEAETPIRCVIEDTGLFALNDGKATIRLTPVQIRKVISFLELTQHVWIHAA